jgi:hypothetical protein
MGPFDSLGSLAGGALGGDLGGDLGVTEGDEQDHHAARRHGHARPHGPGRAEDIAQDNDPGHADHAAEGDGEILRAVDDPRERGRLGLRLAHLVPPLEWGRPHV